MMSQPNCIEVLLLYYIVVVDIVVVVVVIVVKLELKLNTKIGLPTHHKLFKGFEA